MNELQIFNNPDFGDIRVLEKDGEPWFVAADVCKALDLDNSRQAVARLDDDEKNTVILTDGIPGNPNKTIVNEPGLYTLVLGSRKPEAKAFKRWITHDVIPSIRKTGGYTTAKAPQGKELLALAVLEAQKTIEAQNAEIARMKPKEVFADSVTASHTSILIGELAKLIKQNGVDMGQKRLFSWMRENGYLIKRQGTDWNMPTQRSMDKQLFEIKENSIANPDGSIRVTKTPKVTGKGQQYFINLFLAGAEV